MPLWVYGLLGAPSKRHVYLSFGEACPSTNSLSRLSSPDTRLITKSVAAACRSPEQQLVDIFVVCLAGGCCVCFCVGMVLVAVFCVIVLVSRVFVRGWRCIDNL